MIKNYSNEKKQVKNLIHSERKGLNKLELKGNDQSSKYLIRKVRTSNNYDVISVRSLGDVFVIGFLLLAFSIFLIFLETFR